MRSEKRRIAALLGELRPANSLAARLANLTADQQANYQSWRNHADQWQRDYPAADAYERMLEGDAGPRLSRNVADAILGPAPVISLGMTVTDAAECYRRFAFGD